MFFSFLVLFAFSVEELRRNNRNIKRINNEETAEFEAQIGMRQGYALRPLLFSVVLDEVMKKEETN